MLRFLNWLIVTVTTALLRAFRAPGLNNSWIYAWLGWGPAQPLLERLGRRRALDVHSIARRRCPAYREFLTREGAPRVVRGRDFQLIPATTKANYVKAYSVEARCIDGRIPTRGVVVDESSGSSGAPNNWVRGAAERASVQRLLQHGFTLTYRGGPAFLLNCFALGPWATGMNVSMSLADSVILKSIGPDAKKLENTLSLFGPKYHYVVCGYPPFVRDFIDRCPLDLSSFTMHLIVGGEGISEGLRDHFLRVFKAVYSSYGASDLEINIGAETQLSIAVRRLAVGDGAICRDLFGRDEPPMLFQYNPLDYFIETSESGELIFTLLRRGNVCPKVRYNILDIGGRFTHGELMVCLRRHGIDLAVLPRGLHFPFLFVYGRSDLAVPFYGAKIFTTDIDAVLHGEPELRRAVHTFQMSVTHDAAHNEVLVIALERSGVGAPMPDSGSVRRLIFDGLMRVNQDFREVSRMFTIEKLRIETHEFGAGPFANRDIRVKNRYIASSPAGVPPEG